MKPANRLSGISEYYFSKKLKEVKRLLNEGKEIINLGIGNPDLIPPKKAIEVLQKAADSSTSHSYQSYQGIEELRDAIRVFYANHFSVILEKEKEILPLMGSKEGIFHISMAFLNKGDQVLIPNPGYPIYTSITKLVEAEPVYYDLLEENNWLPDLEALSKSNSSKVKLMWVNYPHMPTGANISITQYNKLVNFAKEHHILIASDNPYSFILNKNPSSILSIKDAKNYAIELNSISKMFNMAGWRVGMVLGNEENIKAILKVKSNLDSGMFLPIQKGAIEAIKSDSSWFDKINEIYEKRRELIFQLATKLGCTYSRNISGMFVWAKLPKGVDTDKMVDEMLYNKHIFITPGFVFGSRGEGYIRFSLCINSDQIVKAIERVS